LLSYTGVRRTLNPPLLCDAYQRLSWYFKNNSRL